MTNIVIRNGGENAVGGARPKTLKTSELEWFVSGFNLRNTFLKTYFLYANKLRRSKFNQYVQMKANNFLEILLGFILSFFMYV